MYRGILVRWVAAWLLVPPCHLRFHSRSSGISAVVVENRDSALWTTCTHRWLLGAFVPSSTTNDDLILLPPFPFRPVSYYSMGFHLVFFYGLGLQTIYVLFESGFGISVFNMLLYVRVATLL